MMVSSLPCETNFAIRNTNLICRSAMAYLPMTEQLGGTTVADTQVINFE